MNIRNFYENFHSGSKPYYKLPDEKNYTYGQIFKFLNEITVKIQRPKLSILDLGCGVGPISFFLAQKGHEVVGVDISQNAIKICKEIKRTFKLKNVKFVAGDISEIKFKHKFDLVVMSELIEHIKDDYGLIKNIYNNVNKGGFILVTTPSINAPLYRIGFLRSFDERVGHLRRYSEGKLREVIKRTGFKIIGIRKSEGAIRNFLYTSKIGGILLKAIHRSRFLSLVVEKVDNISLKIFGESNYFVLAVKE